MSKNSLSIRVNSNFFSILSHFFWLGVMLAVVVILSIAMYMQYFLNEIPCPLCLLQRVAFLGIGYGAMMHFRGSPYIRAIGFALMFIFFLEIISLRQSLLDIYPRPGHEWVGSTVLGIHMPVWSFLISLIILLFISLDMIIIEQNTRISISKYFLLNKLANILTLILIIICAINFVSVILQCGFYNCHTDKYFLLSKYMSS